MDWLPRVILLLATLVAGIAVAVPVRPLAEHPPVVAHGGASGYMPEDSMGAFALAIYMGADFVQPTLYVTRDGVVVVTHER